MKKLCRFGKLAAALLLMGSVSGCINVEYVGQSFPALPEYTAVPIFSEKEPLPDAQYRSIGRALVTASDNCPAADIKYELEKTAREHGAEAVKIVHWRLRTLGTTAPEGSTDWQPSRNRSGRSVDGSVIYRDSFGSQPAKLAKPDRAFREIEVEALLLVSEKRFNELAGKKQASAVAEQESRRNPLQNKSREEVLEIQPVAPAAKGKSPEKPAVKMELHGDQTAPVVL